MSDNSTGAGGTAAPGWYADPYDPSQLRWWSGQVWTEHVSPLKPAVQAAVQAADEVPAEEVPAEEVPAEVAPVEVAPVTSDAAAAVAAETGSSTDPATAAAATTPSAPDALPSRRALREAGLDALPVEAAPDDAAPVEAAPVDAAPVEAAPVEAAPVQPVAPVLPVQEVHQPTQALRPEDFELAADQNRWNQPLSTGVGPSWGQPEFGQPEAAPAETAQAEAAQAESGQVDSAQADAARAGAVPAATGQPVADEAPSAAPAATAFDAATPTATTIPPGTLSSAPVAPGAQPDTGALATDDWGLRPTGAVDDAAPRPTTANTPWVWLIAISPLIAAAIIIYALATAAPSFTNVLFLVGFIAPYLLVVVFALADRSRLAILGFTEAAPWTWAALTAPVYLVMRGGVIRREFGSAGPALYVWLACFVIGVAGFALYGLLTGHALVPGLPEGKIF